MASVSQLQLQFSALEDRILLRIKTQDQTELRLWLTRRYVRLLWPVLRGMLEETPQVRAQTSAANREAVLSFQHEEAVSRGDFATAFREGACELPLGEQPVLLARIQLKRSERGAQVLCMHPQAGQGVELAMNPTLAHSLFKLLGDAVRAAQWDLDAGPAAAANATGQPPARVN